MRLALLAFVLLAACGADGPPEPPASKARVDGVTLSGEARAGLVFDE